MHKKLVTYTQQIIKCRLAKEVKGEELEFPEYNFLEDNSPFAAFVTQHNLTLPEIVTLLIALLPQTAPGFLTKVVSEYHPNGSDFTEFGGVKGSNYRGIIPTGETVLYILAGNDIEKRLLVSKLFEEEHLFSQQGILSLDTVDSGEPILSGKLLLDQEFVDLFMYGYVTRPKLSADFPARLVTTTMKWDDLVLNSKTLNQVNDALMWLEHNDALLHEYGMVDKIKPGYRVMFFGPPGVGKTLTASLLGKQTGRDVYRVDLSTVVSKFIGETEKNLSKLFDKAENKKWILFFDEADAIFGKRTGVRDAHDKYANQEVSYLLQRIEAHPGLIILASNYKSNIDKAFTRRFQSIIEFDNPNVEERLILWESYLPKKMISTKIDLLKISKTYDVTGANVVNIVQHACLKTLVNGHKKMTEKTLVQAIEREYHKENRMI